MDNFILIMCVLIILLGLAGTVLPFIPGIPLIFIAIITYGWYENFNLITPKYLAVMGGITFLSVLVDYLSAYWGAKYFGSSKEALYAAILGSILGIFILPPLGIIIFPIIAAVVTEYFKKQDLSAAIHTGVGTIIGLFSGIIFKMVLGTIMLVSFLIIVF